MAAFAKVSELTSLAQYEELKNSGKRVMLFFWADWHEPSKTGGPMHSIVSALAEKYPTVQFFRVEAEAVTGLSELLDITVVPTFYGFAGTNILPKVEGAKPPEISKLAKQVNESPIGTVAISSSSGSSSSNSIGGNVTATTVTTTKAAAETKPSTSQPVQLTPQLKDRLVKLLHSSPIVLFMKGSPAAPRCGFSRQIVEILQSNDIPFVSFDILSDEDVRAGLKLLSDWPTYPQLYAAGELVGGLDIVKDMVASGTSLREQLHVDEITAVPKTVTLNDRLAALINSAPAMLFMKGTPDAPRCGFSRQICGLLKDNDIAFSSFDILEDEDVRSSLKVYSDWPTYPQLYVKGSLVGGLDIVREMTAGGPLKEQLDL